MAKMASLTNYESIYQNVYWGTFIASRNQQITIPSIIHARNWFILKYKVVKNKKCLQKYSQLRRELDLDHTEYYEDALGRFIYVYSMHHSYPLARDFTRIYSMYAPDQTTAIKIFETTKSKNKLYKKITARIPDDVVNIINSYLPKKEKITNNKN
jgi:hypothetical protein